MIKIQLGNKYLDTYADEQLELSWEGFRFQTKLKDGYTNDFKIPKTDNNMAILGAVGLLDSQTQLFGTKQARGIIQVELRIFPIRVQVASLDKNDIGICIYEDSFPEAMKDVTFRDIFTDVDSTIYMWNEHSETNYPDEFKRYHYGMYYDPLYAQYHPVMRVNSLISGMSLYTHYDLPLVDPDWYAMATRKKVCPQNKRQMIEGMIDLDTGDYSLSGGNHITNDLTIAHGEGAYSVVYNRAATVHFDIYLSWAAKNNSYQVPFVVNHNLNGNNDTRSFQIRGDLYKNKIETFSLDFQVQEGSKITFALVSANYYNSSYFLIDSYIDNYTITDDDYDEDLDYLHRRPRLLYYDYNADRIFEKLWDGTPLVYSYKERGTAGSLHQTISTIERSMSYFGYYANLPNTKICDFWFSMQWLMERKLNFDHNRTVTWGTIDGNRIIDGEITEIRPISDKLGQNNFIKYKTDENPLLVSTINNEWLEDKRNFHDSLFTRITNMSQYMGRLNQYSNPEHEVEENAPLYQEFEYKVDFKEVEGLALWWNVTHQGSMIIQSPYIRDIPIPKLGLEKLVQSMEVDITTFTPQLRDKDIIYFNGRKFFVVNGKTDLESQKTQLTCLLVPSVL